MSESSRKFVRIIFKLRALVWGWQGVVPKQAFYFYSANISLSINKNEKVTHPNSTLSKIKFHIIFAYFFSMMDI